MITITILLFVMLAIFKDDLAKYMSYKVQENSKNTLSKTEINNIKESYNYTENELYEYTFLEFGAKSCIACKKMEYVINYIDSVYQNVNVEFKNVRTESGKKYADYFGVVEIPTQILLDKNGVEFFRHKGYIAEYEIEKFFKQDQ